MVEARGVATIVAQDLVMSLEQRGHQLVYYRAFRRDGRVVKVHCGSGIAGRIEYARDLLVRQEREHKRSEWRQQREHMTLLARLVRKACEDLQTGIKAELRAAGYRQHHRSEWRRPLGSKNCLATVARQQTKTLASAKPQLPVKLDLGRRAQRLLVDAIANGNEGKLAAITAKTDELRQELVGPRATTAELLLAERIVLCWLQLHHAEMFHADKAKNGGTAIEYRWAQDWLDKAHNRYLSALTALAKVQRLLRVPAVQVNIAQQQIVSGA